MAVCAFLSVAGFAQNNNKGFIPDSSSYIVISQPSDLTKNASLVNSNIFKFPFMLIDRTLLLMSNDENNQIAFHINEKLKQFEEVFILDSLIVCRDSNVIKIFDGGDQVDDLLIMPDKNYRIFQADRGCFYLVNYKNNSSEVFIVDIYTRKYLKLFDAPFKIDHIVGTKYDCIVTSDRMIYLVSNGFCSIVDVADSVVQSIDFYKGGIFYSTKKACYYLGLPGKSYPFLLDNIKQLMVVDNRLYLLFGDGLLSVIDNADGYRRLLEEVVNEINTEEQ